MIKLLILLLVGFGIGYTYGYLDGDEGQANVIDATLSHVLPRRAGSDDGPVVRPRARRDSTNAALQR